MTGRGHLRARARRLEGALTKSGVGDGEVPRRRGLHRARQGVPLVLPLALRRSRRGCPAPTPSTAATSRCSICCPRTRAARTTCTSSSRPSSITASGSTSSPAGRATIITCLARIDGRSVGIVANNPNHTGGMLDVDSPTRPRTSFRSATPSTSRWCSCRTCPGFMVGSKVEHAGHHPARRQDAARHERGDGAQAHRGGAQGLRRGLLRDVRAGLRARPHRRLAGAEISVMGAEGMVGIAAQEALRRTPSLPRGQAGDRRLRSRPTSTSMKVAGWGLDRRRDRPARHPPGGSPGGSSSRTSRSSTSGHLSRGRSPAKKRGILPVSSRSPGRPPSS
jgi:hypothetical protein